jgi:hypothetical protein
MESPKVNVQVIAKLAIAEGHVQMLNVYLVYRGTGRKTGLCTRRTR